MPYEQGRMASQMTLAGKCFTQPSGGYALHTKARAAIKTSLHLISEEEKSFG